MGLREILLRQIDRLVRPVLDSRAQPGSRGGDLAAHLECKSDAELLAWHDRLRELSLQGRRFDARHPESRAHL